MPGLLPKLVAIYGQDRVVDVFEGTALAEPAKQHGLGGYVVRGVLPQQQVTQWHADLESSCRNWHSFMAVALLS